MGILLFATLISLVKVSDRPIQSVNLSNEIKKEIQLWKGTEDELVVKSLEKTAQILTFAQRNDIKKGKANCVGYAQLFVAIYNYSANINKYQSKAKPVVGYLKLGGVNLCKQFKSIMPNTKWKNFVKDHDFVEIHLRGKKYYLDPSIYDVIGDPCITYATTTFKVTRRKAADFGTKLATSKPWSGMGVR